MTKKVKFLDRTEILKRDKFRIEEVDLGNDEFVYVKQMSGSDRDQFEASMLVKKEVNGKIEVTQKWDNFRAKLAEATLCDEKGALLLREGDYKILSRNMTSEKLEKIVKVASEINAISTKDKENIVKNSKADQADNSSSDSVKK